MLKRVMDIVNQLHQYHITSRERRSRYDDDVDCMLSSVIQRSENIFNIMCKTY